MTSRITLVAFAALMAGLLFGCAGDVERPPDAVATIRPIGAIVEPVLGSEVRVLLSPGASPHTYDPRPSDVRAAGSAAVLFYGAAELDGWAARLDAPARMALLPMVPESLLVRAGTEHADPHFWMDPLTVRALLPALTDSLCSLAAERCDAYRLGGSTFSRQLSEVHDSVATLMRDAAGSSVLLAHPFLSYFARRYDLEVAGVVEEIPGSEPTPRDMMRMVAEAEQANAMAIFTLPQHPSRAAEAVSEATGLPLVELDPIGGGANGYADLLYFNAARIRNALLQTAKVP